MKTFKSFGNNSIDVFVTYVLSCPALPSQVQVLEVDYWFSKVEVAYRSVQGSGSILVFLCIFCI